MSVAETAGKPGRARRFIRSVVDTNSYIANCINRGLLLDVSDIFKYTYHKAYNALFSKASADSSKIDEARLGRLAKASEKETFHLVQQALGSDYEIIDTLGGGTTRDCYHVIWGKNLLKPGEKGGVEFVVKVDKNPEDVTRATSIENLEKGLNTFNDLSAIIQLGSKAHRNGITELMPASRVFEGRAISVEKYFSKTTLDDVIKSEGKLNKRDFKIVSDQLVHALEFLSLDHNMLHRDLKPSNIMFRRSAEGRPEVILTDFANKSEIGKHSDSWNPWKPTHGGRVVTDPWLMPLFSKTPGEYTFQSELYSLGMTLYKCLTGFFPFHYDPENKKATVHPKLRDMWDKIKDREVSILDKDGNLDVAKHEYYLKKAIAYLPRWTHSDFRGNEDNGYGRLLSRMITINKNARFSSPEQFFDNYHIRERFDNAWRRIFKFGFVLPAALIGVTSVTNSVNEFMNRNSPSTPSRTVQYFNETDKSCPLIMSSEVEGLEMRLCGAGEYIMTTPRDNLHNVLNRKSSVKMFFVPGEINSLEIMLTPSQSALASNLLYGGFIEAEGFSGKHFIFTDMVNEDGKSKLVANKVHFDVPKDFKADHFYVNLYCLGNSGNANEIKSQVSNGREGKRFNFDPIGRYKVLLNYDRGVEHAECLQRRREGKTEVKPADFFTDIKEKSLIYADSHLSDRRPFPKTEPRDE